MELFRLSEQNRWWEDDRAFSEDPHIKTLNNSPVKIVHPLENQIRLDDDRIYILRGPRQVGKTTLLKKLIKAWVDQGTAPSRTVYFAFDTGGMRDDRDVLDILKTYLTWARSRTQGRLWVFLDEVTYTPNWSTGIKAAFDLNLLNNVSVIATGSSSLDSRRGGERLPGRRGEKPEENDLTMLPLSFRSFLKSVSPEVDIPAFGSLTPEDKKWLKRVGGGILLSQDGLEYDSGANIVTVPASYFLAGLSEI